MESWHLYFNHSAANIFDGAYKIKTVEFTFWNPVLVQVSYSPSQCKVNSCFL